MGIETTFYSKSMITNSLTYRSVFCVPTNMSSIWRSGEESFDVVCDMSHSQMCNSGELPVKFKEHIYQILKEAGM